MVFSKKVISLVCISLQRKKQKVGLLIQGKFIVRWIDTQTATLYQKELVPGDTWHNPLQPNARSTRRW